MVAAVADFATGSSGSANATAVTVNKPANVVDGDLLVAVVHGRSNTAQYTTIPSGWTAANPGGTRTTSLGWQTIFYKPLPTGASSEPASYQWAGGASGRHEGIIFRVTGADLSNVIEAVGNDAIAIGGTPQTLPMPAVTAVNNNGLLITGEHTQVTTGASPVDLTPPAGITKITTVTTTTAAQNNNLGASYKQLSASGSTGTMTFSATGTLQSGLGYAVIIKSAAASNVAPTANAGADQTGIEPYTTVTLNGSGSSDSDGTIASYAWTQTAGSPTVTLSGTGANRTFTAPNVVGGTTLTFGLTVTDNGGATSTQDTMTVTVLGASEAIRVSGAWSARRILRRSSGAWV
jgi:hypothetical protein